jgi:hypothetical protein
MTVWRRRLQSGAAAALVLFSTCTVGAQPAARSEYEIKAAYLFTFAKFVEWQARAGRDDSSYTICILGPDPFGPVLDSTLNGVSIRGRKVGARRLPSDDPSTAGCHIVFVGAADERSVNAIVAPLTQEGVLTVSDMPRFAERGGMIQFVTLANRVRFEINLAAARDAGLMMSSELLRVASAIRNGRRVQE